jgi:hypothetical protein
VGSPHARDLYYTLRNLRYLLQQLADERLTEYLEPIRLDDECAGAAHDLTFIVRREAPLADAYARGLW